MTTDLAPLRRALLSVSDKTGLIALGQSLAARGVELLSTGGSAKALRDAGLDVKDVLHVQAIKLAPQLDHHQLDLLVLILLSWFFCQLCGATRPDFMQFFGRDFVQLGQGRFGGSYALAHVFPINCLYLV